MPSAELSIGDKIPDFRAISIWGDTLYRSDFEGNIVLIDFWASWNLPSRKHNLGTKKIYEKYRALSLRKKRKFIVVQVSLDNRKDLLETAISKDNLYWKTQFCDYKGWKSPLIDRFGITKLPSNFLINTEGIIVAKNVWEANLDNALADLMK
jgi:peroxiredoxin